MLFKYELNILLCIILSHYLVFVQARGLLILYRPRDLTTECVFSEKIRYDISFGMGMSDTITLVLRTLTDVDYECEIDISTDISHHMIVVIKFPNSLAFNCDRNPTAFHVMKKRYCYAVCDELVDQNIFDRYWILYTRGRFRFQFRSNSSINSDMNAYLYEVTVTTARLRGRNRSCYGNETECYAPPPYDEHYCMTSGVVCDGIMNCGADDWFDERKSECEIPTQHLGYPPILAVVAILMCALLAVSHILQRCVPKASSFFIFNTNEDNRLCIDAVMIPPASNQFESSDYFQRKKSVIPMDWNDSSLDDSDEEDEPKVEDLQILPLSKLSATSEEETKDTLERRKALIMKAVTARIQQRLRSVARPREST